MTIASKFVAKLMCAVITVLLFVRAQSQPVNGLMMPRKMLMEHTSTFGKPPKQSQMHSVFRRPINRRFLGSPLLVGHEEC